MPEHSSGEISLKYTLEIRHHYIPNSADVPEITVLMVENPDPLSPYGCKGIGEPALELIAPAMAGALYRATGQRSTTLPLQPSSAVGPWNLEEGQNYGD